MKNPNHLSVHFSPVLSSLPADGSPLEGTAAGRFSCVLWQYLQTIRVITSQPTSSFCTDVTLGGVEKIQRPACIVSFVVCVPGL